MLWICSGEILIHLDRAGPMTHLNQMTKSIFFNLSFLCGNLFPIFLLGVWIQYTQVLASVPSKCFSICHLPRITGIIIFYLLIQRGKLGLGFFFFCFALYQLSVAVIASFAAVLNWHRPVDASRDRRTWHLNWPALGSLGMIC